MPPLALMASEALRSTDCALDREALMRDLGESASEAVHRMDSKQRTEWEMGAKRQDSMARRGASGEEAVEQSSERGEDGSKAGSAVARRGGGVGDQPASGFGASHGPRSSTGGGAATLGGDEDSSSSDGWGDLCPQPQKPRFAPDPQLVSYHRKTRMPPPTIAPAFGVGCFCGATPPEKPVVLRCRHRICLKHLIDIKKVSENGQEDLLTCPFCGDCAEYKIRDGHAS